MRSPIRSLAFAFALLISIMQSTSRAQWQLDGAGVGLSGGASELPVVVSDGVGGAIIAWQDYRSGVADIYVQRIDAAGVPLWTANGVPICTAPGHQLTPAITGDSFVGGAIITWIDGRNGGHYDIFAQRVNAAGSVQWAANGVSLCNAIGDQVEPRIVGLGGGAYVVWEDYRSGFPRVHAQRVDPAGVVQWTAIGVTPSNLFNNHENPVVVLDGTGGIIMAWEDARSGNRDIYAQRISSAAFAQWTPNGVSLCGAPADQVRLEMIADGSGGAIAAWEDYRVGASITIYAQRVSAAGTMPWTIDGVNVGGAPSQFDPVLVSDGAGGAILAWEDYRTVAGFDMYAQRILSAGYVLWPSGGVALCTAVDSQVNPTIATDGGGGVVVAWQDYRSGSPDLYAQRVSGLGVATWTAGGVRLCTAPGTQSGVQAAFDFPGAAILTWQDHRAGVSGIYAQRLEPKYGYWGRPEPVLVSAVDVPGDQGGQVQLNWSASSHDVFNLQEITHYSIWRATDEVAAAALVSTAAVVVASPNDVSEDFDGSAVWVQRVKNTDYYWEWIANQDAHYLSAYSYTAPTLTDWTLADPNDHSFFISAHATEPFVFFDSNILSGHSIDNIAPGAPLMLTAYRAGSSVVLNWNRPLVQDLRDFAVYRATSSGVTPIGGNFVAGTADTTLVDANAPASTLYYIVTAYDVHDNQGAPSNEADVGVVTGIGDTPAITAITVAQNYPNPFAGSTQLEIGLPAKSDVSIDVFDVAGRRVRTMNVSGAAAGWQRVPFSGTDDRGKSLASGVYFYRVTAAGTTVTHKMVIAR